MFFCSNCTNYPVRPAPFRYTGANEDEAFYGGIPEGEDISSEDSDLRKMPEDENERTGLKGISK